MFVTHDGLALHVRIDGPAHALPVLMLHSLGTDARVYEPQVALLARHHRVIRPDLRGHGLSGLGGAETSMAELARDAVAVLDEAGVGAAHVVGLSIGGRIAMELAASHPNRVASLILCDTGLEFPPASNWQARIDAVGAGGMSAIADGVMGRWVVDQASPGSAALRRMLLGTPAEGYAACAAALRDAKAAPLEGRIHVPTTIVVGDQDLATPPEWSRAILAAIPGARLIEIAGGAHIPTFEKTAELNAAILGHLERLPAGDDLFAAGMAVRRAVLGSSHVDRASAQITALDAPFQEWITRNVWGAIWTRPGLDRKTRSLLTLAMMAALGRDGEFVLHVRATRNTGVTPEEIAEVLLAVGAYAGVPAANHALKLAKQTLAEMEDQR